MFVRSVIRIFRLKIQGYPMNKCCKCGGPVKGIEVRPYMGPDRQVCFRCRYGTVNIFSFMRGLFWGRWPEDSLDEVYADVRKRVRGEIAFYSSLDATINVRCCRRALAQCTKRNFRMIYFSFAFLIGCYRWRTVN